MAEARSAVHEPHVGRIEEGRSAQHDFYVGLRASIIRRFFRTRCVHNQSTETAERTVTALSFSLSSPKKRVTVLCLADLLVFPQDLKRAQ